MLGQPWSLPGTTRSSCSNRNSNTPQDGAEKQDCENAAAKRWLAAHGAQYARLNPIYLGAALFPASRCVRRFLPSTGISSSSASRPLIP